MSDLININEADEATLTEISGIGEALAARIVEYRETVHPFEEVIELTAVPGISERMVREFEAFVTVAPVVADAVPLLEDAESVDAEVVEDVGEEEAVVDETAVSPPPDFAFTSDESSESIAEPPSSVEEDPDPDADIFADAKPVEEEEFAEVDAPADRAQLPDMIEEEIEEAAEAVDEIASDDEPEPVEVETPVVETIVTAPPDFFVREESETPMETETIETETPTPETPPAPVAENVSQRRGCIFIIIGAVAGAILGMALTLALLAALNNGSLQYAQSNSRLQNQLESVTTSLDELNQELESANQNLEAVATRSGTLADDQNDMSDVISGFESTLGNAQEGLEAAQEDIEALTETAVTLDERIDTISESSEKFDVFLTGMRDLLVELQGVPVPTKTPFATITPEADDATATVEADEGDESETAVTPTPSPTRIPTRTPRPTSTPISLPTATPAQQP